MKIAWDICEHIHAMSDLHQGHLDGTCERHPNYTAECYAQMDGKPCKRHGRCIIARNAATWKQVTSKSFTK